MSIEEMFLGSRRRPRPIVITCRHVESGVNRARYGFSTWSSPRTELSCGDERCVRRLDGRLTHLVAPTSMIARVESASLEQPHAPALRQLDRHLNARPVGVMDQQRLASLEDVIAAFAEECDRWGIVLDDHRQVSRSSSYCNVNCMALQGTADAQVTVLGIDSEQMNRAIAALQQSHDVTGAGIVKHERFLSYVSAQQSRAYHLIFNLGEDEYPFARLDDFAHICHSWVNRPVPDMAEDSYCSVQVNLGGLVNYRDSEVEGLFAALSQLFISACEGRQSVRTIHESSPFSSGQVLVTPASFVTVAETTDIASSESSQGVGSAVGALAPTAAELGWKR